ncbi:Hsp20/alpha crystallin family protein [Variovorax saccharolyticus]|uniref:Hsp20/alpha crystallin family protein n=1 Tax=Variovorax saccharolyticus TaxID=3053516 RepID=UPI002574D253|nr:Hsp20/alpha crystallin family protein [Variovorax sp. J22R187]MDM0022427.1 Hsp20/alpha crystallin family protein [Variovorax sp. J22R187]
MYRSLFPRDMFAEMDRLQREMQQALDLSPTIRGFGRGGFPALNIGGTPQTVEVYAFAPGLAPDAIDITLDRGVLTIAGTRPSSLPERSDTASQAAVHISERFAGGFRRVISLPDDADPENVEARYRDGVLQITIQRRASAQPRRIDIH